MPVRRYAALLVAATAVVAVAPPSHAQTAGDGFLFRHPVGSFGIRGGFDRAFAGSDIFSFVTKQLTLNRSDFSSVTFGSNVAVRVSDATDLVIDVSLANVSHLSEFRDWIDNNNNPIQQTTALFRMPVTLGVRHYLTTRGRSIGRFAFIPAPRTFYIGGGAGMMRYTFRQYGDFIDFQTLNVFPDAFRTSGWTPTLHALVGMDIGLGHALLVTTEARYTWARGPMGDDYVGFHAIDLSGISASAGLALRL